jgi:hypothetical protein
MATLMVLRVSGNAEGIFIMALAKLYDVYAHLPTQMSAQKEAALLFSKTELKLRGNSRFFCIAAPASVKKVALCSW